MWPGIWFMWPASGHIVPSRSAERMPRSGIADISSRWICKWRIAGCCAMPASSAEADRPLANLQRLDNVRIRRRRARLEVPEAPHGAHHQRLDKQRHHVVVVGKAGVDRPHLGGVGVIPLLEFLRRHAMRLLETVGKRLDQSPFDRTGASGVGARKLDMLEAAPGRAVGLGVAMFLPGQIVEGPGGVSDAPMHHGASGIAFQRLLEALDAFFVVEAVAPVQADIEPALGFRRAGGDGAPIGAKVEAIHAAFFLSHSWRPARLPVSRLLSSVMPC